MLHMVKLCVGVDTAELLERNIDREMALAGLKKAHIGLNTRSFPARVAEIVPGGSLYWVMKGHIACRQAIVGIRRFVDGGGASRCWIVLEPSVVRTSWAAYRPFQGWRYLEEDKAPPDIPPGDVDMPASMRQDLARLGLV